jgi:hypothetical protein
VEGIRFWIASLTVSVIMAFRVGSEVVALTDFSEDREARTVRADLGWLSCRLIWYLFTSAQYCFQVVELVADTAFVGLGKDMVPSTARTRRVGA